MKSPAIAHFGGKQGRVPPIIQGGKMLLPTEEICGRPPLCRARTTHRNAARRDKSRTHHAATSPSALGSVPP
ncbi:hypothetical protein K0U00_28290, partial [Paenibacillus sepulcri]|nr:hypothetical protein [Paenibacillus sepulcri]